MINTKIIRQYIFLLVASVVIVETIPDYDDTSLFSPKDGLVTQVP